MIKLRFRKEISCPHIIPTIERTGNQTQVCLTPKFIIFTMVLLPASLASYLILISCAGFHCLSIEEKCFIVNFPHLEDLTETFKDTVYCSLLTGNRRVWSTARTLGQGIMEALRVRQASDVSRGNQQIQKSSLQGSGRYKWSACHRRIWEVNKMLKDWNDFESQG